MQKCVLTRCVEHDKGVLLLLQGLPEVFSSKMDNTALFFFPCRLRWRWCFRTRKEVKSVWKCFWKHVNKASHPGHSYPERPRQNNPSWCLCITKTCSIFPTSSNKKMLIFCNSIKIKFKWSYWSIRIGMQNKDLLYYIQHLAAKNIASNITVGMNWEQQADGIKRQPI